MIKQGTNTIAKIPGTLVAYVGGDVVYHALPTGYTECSYVRGNANAYFETNLYLTNDSEVICDVQYEGSAGNTYGCYTSSSANDNFCLYGGASSGDAYIRYNGELLRAFRATSGTRYKLKHNAGGFWVNGTNVGTFNTATFTCTAPFVVGNLSNSTAAKLKGRIYRLTVKESGQTVMDMVPCTNSNSVYGLYDVVGRQFYASSGTAFTGG